ncbi:MAG: preprotein translocase subunit SecE [Chloroflexi bacterium 44-23]|nr:MAG: preprotein translocase subunit SecE [Chloroflexi bacterium 44-23]
MGELRKVSWPTPQEAWRLTKVVLLVVFVMAMILGLLDFLFSRGIAALVSI